MLQHNIKLLRQQKSMTQKQLADELHVTPQAVSRWENGEVEPSVSAIGEMAKIFGVTYDELMRGKEENLPEEEIAAAKINLSRRKANQATHRITAIRLKLQKKYFTERRNRFLPYAKYATNLFTTEMK